VVHTKHRASWQLALLAIILGTFSGSLFAQQDPPSRVARLNYLNGNVSMEPAGVDDWAPADLNRPFTIGDYLFADQGAQAELHLDVAVIRMGAQTSFGFLNLDDRTVQLKLSEGDMNVRLHNFASDQVFEVDTPNAAVTLLRDGSYRFRVDPSGNMSFVVVREGQAEITGGGQAITLDAGNSATLNGTDQLSYDVEIAPQADEFDQWSEQRDMHEERTSSARYLPPTVIGSEDLGDYGSWQDSGDYGAVWYPRSVDSGWAPYHNGHWAWIDPWGWTWVDSMPWGFAPFHYGRWAYIGNRWGWCPGPIAVGHRGPVVRPYYAPAMVAWFGGAHWGVGVSLGGGPSLGWVPLGFGELYTPSYRCTPRYFNNVNVHNTRVVNNVNITNVYNNVYVNKQVYNQQYVNVRAPNAVMAMPQTAFASGRPVRQAGVPLRPAELARTQGAAVSAPQIAPTRQSVMATAANRPAVRPAPQVVQRQVVARNVPPAQPASFASRQAVRQPGAGSERPSVVPAARTVAANVRQAPAASPVVVRPGQRGGNPAAFNRPGDPRAPQQAPNGRAVEPGGGGRPGAPPAAGRPHTAVSGTVSEPAPGVQAPGVQAPGVPQPSQRVHGVPPNMRQPNTPPADNGRYTQPTPQNAPQRTQPQMQERSQPRVQPTPAERTALPQWPQPQVQERSQPRVQPAPAERTAPPERPQPQVQERSQPRVQPTPAERTAPPQWPQPQVQERSQPRVQPAPAERTAPPERPQPQVQERSQPRVQPAPAERTAPPERQQPQMQERSQPRNQPPAERAAPPPRQESRPAPAHEDHPKNDHPKDDHKGR